jgi:hypothetical protein
MRDFTMTSSLAFTVLACGLLALAANAKPGTETQALAYFAKQNKMA